MLTYDIIYLSKFYDFFFYMMPYLGQLCQINNINKFKSNTNIPKQNTTYNITSMLPDFYVIKSYKRT